MLIAFIFVAFLLAFTYLFTRPKTGQVENKQITLNLVYGTRTGTYAGSLVNGLPDGEGTFTTRNPAGNEWNYSGQWKSGHMNGSGKMIWADGPIHEGNFLNDRLEGLGKITDETKNVYEGEFVRGLAIDAEYADIMINANENVGYELDSVSSFLDKYSEATFLNKKQIKETLMYYFREMQKTSVSVANLDIEKIPKEYYPVHSVMKDFADSYQQASIHLEKGALNSNAADLNKGTEYLDTAIEYINEAFELKEKIDNGEPIAEIKQNPPTISLEEYSKLTEGMSYSSVVRIIGGQGEKQSEVGKKGEDFYTVSYSWSGEGSLGANAYIMFQEDKLITKAQYGLE